MIALPETIFFEADTIDAAQGPLWDAEKALVAKAVPRRRQQFTAGRVLARRALARAGQTAQAVLADEHRCPLWPEGIVGSISHTDTWCVAAVASRTSVISLGIDVEEPERVEPHLWQMLFTDREIADLAVLPEQKRRLWAGCIFSLKEAFYKYQYPLTHRMVGFKDIEIEPSSAADTAVIRIVKPIAAPLVKGAYLPAKYVLENHLVCAAVYGESLSNGLA